MFSLRPSGHFPREVSWLLFHLNQRWGECFFFIIPLPSTKYHSNGAASLSSKTLIRCDPKCSLGFISGLQCINCAREKARALAMRRCDQLTFLCWRTDSDDSFSQVCVCPVRDWQPVRSLTKTGSCMGTRDTNKQQSQLAEQENASWNLFFSFIMCSRFKAEGQQDIHVFMLSTERLFFLISASAEMLRVIISLSAFCQTTGSTSNAHESRRVSTFWFEPFLTHMCRFLTHEQDEAWLAGSLLAGPGWQQNVSIRVREWIWPHQTCWRLSCSFNYWIIVKVIFSAQLNKMLQSSRETQTTNYCQSSSNSVARVKWHQ